MIAAAQTESTCHARLTTMKSPRIPFVKVPGKAPTGIIGFDEITGGACRETGFLAASPAAARLEAPAA